VPFGVRPETKECCPAKTKAAPEDKLAPTSDCPMHGQAAIDARAHTVSKPNRDLQRFDMKPSPTPHRPSAPKSVRSGNRSYSL
jgi:hypothetical protein